MRSGKVRTFMLFLFLACVIWVLTKFSKEDSASVMAQLSYTDIPTNTVLAEDNLNTISFDVTGTGYDFLLYKIKQPVIELAVENYYDPQTGRALIDNAQLVQLIARELDGKQGIRNLSANRLEIQLDRVQQKKVPVEAVTEFTFKEGFRPVGTMRIQPDSVTLEGPGTVLDSLRVVSTRPIRRQRLDRDLEEEIAVETGLPEELKVRPGLVVVRQRVEEFSPKEVSIPLELINAPANREIKMVPPRITLSFDVPISSFNSISAQDFSVQCDYKKRNSEENFLLPELVDRPEEAVNIEFSHKKISYLIFKATN